MSTSDLILCQKTKDIAQTLYFNDFISVNRH